MDTHISSIMLDGKVTVVVSESLEVHSIAVCNLLAVGGKEIMHEIINCPLNKVVQ